MSTKPNRRRFLKAVSTASVAALPTFAGCVGSDDDSSGGEEELADKIKLHSWGGSFNEMWKKHVGDPFEQEYGVSLEMASFGHVDDLLAKIRSSPDGTIHMVNPTDTGLYPGIKQELFEPIRTDNLENWSQLLPQFQDHPADVGSETYGVPVYYGTSGMTYNTEQVDGSPPFSWESLWDSHYKGSITLEDVAKIRVFHAALYLGLDPNNLDDGSYDENIQRVYDAMAEQHKLVTKYFGSGQDINNLYTKKEAVIGEGWGGRIMRLQQEGHEQLKYTIPEEGAYTWSGFLALAKGSGKRYTAEKFMDFVLSEDVMKNLAPGFGYPPATKVDSDEVTALPDYDPTGGDRLLLPDHQYMEPYVRDWQDTFEKIKLGQY